MSVFVPLRYSLSLPTSVTELASAASLDTLLDDVGIVSITTTQTNTFAYQLDITIAVRRTLDLSLPGVPGVRARVFAGVNPAQLNQFTLQGGWKRGGGAQVEASFPLELTLGIAGLRPAILDADGPRPDPAKPELVIQLTPAITYDSTAGIHVEIPGGLNVPAVLIGSTGFAVELAGFTLRANPFAMSIAAATLHLPKALKPLNVGSLSLTNVSISDAGLTGTASIDWAPALSANLFGLTLSLEHLAVTLTLNQLTELELNGTLTLPALTDASGAAAPIPLLIEAGTTGYRIVAGDVPPLKLGGVELDLDGLSLSFDDDDVTSVDIGGVLRIPGLEAGDGGPAEIGVEIEYDAGVYTLQASSFPPLSLGPFSLSLDSLDLSFDQTGLRSSELAGTVTVPGLEAAGGGPARVGVRIGVGADAFTLTVNALPPFKLGALELTLDTFALSVGRNVPFAATIEGELTIPNAKDANGNPVVIGFGLLVDGSLFRLEASTLPAFDLAGLRVQLTELSIGFDEGGIVAAETAIAGTVRVPAFTDDAGNPIDISVSVDMTDGFDVTAEVPGGELEVLDLADIIRIALTKLSVGVGAQGVRFSIGARVDNRLKIPMVEELLPSNVTINDLSYRAPDDVDLDIALTWPNGLTVGSDGTGAFEVDVPIGEIGAGLSLDSIHLAFRDAGDAYAFAIAFRGAVLELGPVIGLVDGLGIEAKIKPEPTGGNLGPLQVDLAFIPPTGIGLSLEAGAVKLAGFLGIEEDGYVGAAELSIADSFGLSVVGLLTTQMPDGSEGLSLLAIVSVELPSPIHIAYGIFFAGAGGLLGLHRSVDVDRLSAGLKTGATDSILFPKDVLRNINAIVTDVREVFPPTKDQFVIGPMLLLTWSTPPLISAKMGLIVELPNPVSISILGSIRAALPTEDEAILDLKVAFLGAIELDKGLIRFDAALYDSYIGKGDWKIYIEGDFSLRISYGERKDFVNSVGGFHPLYSPPDYLKLPTPMNRLRVSLLKDNPRISLSTYFAITSNTIQLGAELSFRFDAAVFSIEGGLGFDVLFQFSPFRFIARVWASLALKLVGMDLLAIKLDFQLQGPSPWIASGTASLKVLFWDVHAEFEVTIGEREELDAPRVDVLPIVLQEFERPENWIGELPSGVEQLVQLRELTRKEGEVLLDGSSTLRVAQSAVPLNLELERYGPAEPSDARRVIVQAFRVADAEQPYDAAMSDFAPAAYKAMSDREKLKAASFEPKAGGVRMREDRAPDAGTALQRPVQYEVFVSDVPPPAPGEPGAAPDPQGLGKAAREPEDRFARWASGGVVAKSPAAVAARRRQERRKAVTVASERFAVVRGSDLQPVDRGQNLTRSEAEELRGRMRSAAYIVVPDYKKRAS